MKLREFIVTDAILPNLSSTEREGVLRELVTSLADAGAIPQENVEELVAAVVKRETEATTGFGRGVAVPHVKHPRITKMVATVGRSVTGVDFGALDKQPVFSFVLLLSPPNQPEQHLGAMNAIFNSLQQDLFRRFLRQSDTREKIVDLLDEADQGR